ncbi:MAG: DUF5103 domain-containing protein [Balneola sp.]|nr:MAG: DUF5103 domain-containing protein [Balneola sp.]
MPVSLICRLLTIPFFLFLVSCSNTENQLVSTPVTTTDNTSLLLVPNQLKAPPSIKGVQLYRKGNQASLPIIELNSENKLILEFDELTTLSGQFIIQFSHRNQDWSKSGLPDPWIMEGINELVLFGGEPNRTNRPNYFHYSLEFPTREIEFKVSGNYLLHVLDYNSGTELFSLPFFISEQEGEQVHQVETLFNQGQNGQALDQLFGEYRYPDFVEFPQFNLSYTFTQNRFWGQSRKADQYSFTNEGETEFHISRGNAFPASFDFTSLNLSELSLQNPSIFSIDPTAIPTEVILKDDFLNFLSDPSPTFNAEFGLPDKSLLARYSEVSFRLNTGGNTTINDFYLIGDFNQWSISDREKLRYNRELGVWETKLLIKEGNYSYKYVTLEGKEIDPILLSDSITKRDQEYVSFVYYLDPDLQYDRLLHAKLFQ